MKLNKSFTLTGKLIGRDTGYIILIYPYFDKWIRDTTYVSDGAFEFKGKISEPSFVAITTTPKEEGNYTNIYLEEGNQTIVLKENKFHAFKMRGSYAQVQSDSLNSEIERVKYKYRQLYNDYDSANRQLIDQKDSILKKIEEEKTEELYKQLQNPTNEIQNLKITFIAQYPDSYVSPTELLSVINYLPIDSAELLFNEFTQRIRDSRAGKLCSAVITKRVKTKNGTIIPNFVAMDINGKTISISQFKGKYLLLDFWASWCVPCRQQVPNLIKMYNTYHKKGLEMIGISDDKDAVAWKKAIEKDGTDIWNNLLAIQKYKEEKIDSTYSIIRIYNVYFLPTKILIDKKGEIIGRYGTGGEGETSMYKKLKQLFK